MPAASLPPSTHRAARLAYVEPSSGPRAAQAIQVVLSMLREQTGMDVVFVRQFSEGPRHFRMVEALSHGPAAALATTREPGDGMGQLLEAAVVLRDGRVHGHLCGHAAQQDAAASERQLRALRHGARLAARLLDQEAVLQELSRLAL